VAEPQILDGFGSAAVGQCDDDTRRYSWAGIGRQCELRTNMCLVGVDRWDFGRHHRAHRRAHRHADGLGPREDAVHAALRCVGAAEGSQPDADGDRGGTDDGQVAVLANPVAQLRVQDLVRGRGPAETA